MAIPASRNSAAFQTHLDWAAVRDNKPIYFGNDFDASIKWNTSTSKLEFTGATSFTGAWSVAGDVNVSGGDIAVRENNSERMIPVEGVYTIRLKIVSTAP